MPHPPRVRTAALAACMVAGALLVLQSKAVMQSAAPDMPGAEGTALPTTASGAATYNLRVVTDASPDLSDLDSFIASATADWPTDREKVWALFYWGHILRRQTSPMVLHGYEVTDPIRNFSDYGFTMCSTITGINQVLFEALGLRHHYWDICGHTVSAVEYDGMFHMVDTSMSNLVTREDGETLASVEEIAANSARLARLYSLYSTSPNGFLTGSDTGRNLSPFVTPDGGIMPGYSAVFCADRLMRRDNYYNWNAGHRYVLNLRDRESYTRYYRKLGDTPAYWVGSESVSNPDPANRFDIEAYNRFGVRGNGTWSFAPSLAAGDYARAVFSQANIVANPEGGIRPRTAGTAGEVVYKVDAANAMTSQQIRATFSRADAQASATLSVSLNHGLSWREVGRLGSQTGSAVPLDANLRDEVSGHTEALVRVQMTAASAAADALVLTSLRVDTVTQVNAKALPRLHVGKNRIHVGAGEQTQTLSLWPELRGDAWSRNAHTSTNIGSQPVSLPRPWEGAVFPADPSREASLTYRLVAPGDLTRLVYGGRLFNRGPGAHIEFWHSFDGGQNWILSYRLTDTSAPWDVIHYSTVTDIPPGARSVLFKYTMHSDGLEPARPGLFSIRMEAQHQPPVAGARPVEVTLRWKEIQADRSRVDRSHKQRVTQFPFEYEVNAGGVDHPVMESLRVNLDGAGDSAPLGYSDGVNAGGEKFQYRWRTDGANLAAGRPYTFSRAPSGFQSSAPAGNTVVLTDGVVGSPQTGGTHYYWGQCWSASSPLALTVDLGSTSYVGAARAHLFGYPGYDALAGDVQDRIELLTSLDGVNYLSRGTFDTWVPRKEVPVNHMLMDDERATGWNFEHLLPSAVQARYVRYQISSPRILCASELQVLDRVDYTPFDMRITLPRVQNNGNALPRSGWTATASHQPASAPRAIDGDPGSRWDTGAGQSNGQWFQLDLGAPRAFDRLVLDASGSPGDYPRDYRVSVSDTGSTWVDVATGSGSSPVVNVAFPVQTRRYVRVTQTGTSGSWWSIHELQLFSASPVGPATPTPYAGTPVSLPGTVEAENYDNGGNGVAYWDTGAANEGGAYRLSESVDVEGSGGIYNVGWIDTAEWLLYSVNVASAGTYRARLRVASPLASGTGQVSLTFGNATSPVAGVPYTGSWSSYQEIVVSGLSLAAGPQFLRVNAVRSGWNLDKLVIEAESGTPPPSGSTPYLGTPVSLPGTVEAENYDNGGNGVAYSDSTSVNSGGAYRLSESVDVEGSGGIYNVGWIDTAEWLLYSVNVASAGTYRARLRVASPLASGTGQVSLTFGNATSPVAGVPYTGSWSSYQEIVVSGLSLAAGPQFLRVNAVHSGWNLDKLVIEAESGTPPPSGSTPYLGTPVSLPGTVEAENYDNGGSGVAYWDTGAANEGGAYRQAEGVDIQGAVDAGGGHNVGWMAAGEWLAFTVHPASAGTYTMRVRVAANGVGGRFHLEAGGRDVSGPLAIPNTGGWQNWTTVEAPVTLSAGIQVLRLVLDANGPTGVFGNVNWLSFSVTATAPE